MADDRQEPGIDTGQGPAVHGGQAESTGSEALAWGALDAGVQFVTGYPGSPATAAVEALLRTGVDPAVVRIEWAINEKSAADAALGVSLAGGRALVCLKNVGLNVALDALMVANLAPGDGALVILVGDDPGGWGSQNEEDSRPLAAAAEVPLLEPGSVAEARAVMRYAFDLSERVKIAVVVRVVRALIVDQGPAGRHLELVRLGAGAARLERQPGLQGWTQGQPGRWLALPIQVVALHRQLQAKMAAVRAEFEETGLNREAGEGPLGIIAAGQTGSKLAEVMGTGHGRPLRVLRLTTLQPLPERQIVAFLRATERVLVLEETAPLVETAVQALAQRCGLALPILGRASGHVPGAGELFAPEIALALAGLDPGGSWPAAKTSGGGRIMPSRQSLCDGCPYIPVVEGLLAAMARHGGREAFFVSGETGCLVRAHLPPWEVLDAKYSMGSSIGLAAGLARAGIGQRVIALSGDSAFLHNGLGELIDTVLAGVTVLVIVLDNGTTALSGGQPHPGSAHDAQGRPRRPVDLAALVRAAGVEQVTVLDPIDREALEAALERGLTSPGVSVIIARHPCPVWARAER